MENTKSHFIEIESHEGKDLIIRSTASREETAGILAAAPKTSTPPMKETFPHS